MKAIRIADQPRLGLGRILRITLDGVRYRIFRAGVTVAVIAVAVAFLMNILGESLIKRAVARDTRARIEHSRLVHDWAARLSAPGTVAALLREAAAAAPGSRTYADLQRLGGLDDAAMAQLHAAAVRAVRHLDFFGGLDYARRRRLVHTAEGVAVFDRLAAPGGLAAFRRLLADTPSVRLVDEPDALEAFVAAWPRTRERIARIQAGQRAAINRVAAALDGRTLIQALTDADGAFGDAVRTAGFPLPGGETAREVARQARRLLDVRLLEKSLEHRAPRQAIARAFGVLPGDVTLLLMWRYLANPRAAADYIEELRPLGLWREGLDADRITNLSAHWRENLELERAERLTAAIGGGWLGLGRRMGWLLLVSMLVCGIGISNAMLMTVTERFREIATLKCLGALDGFIMLMFVMESCLLGLVGGLVGGLLGGLLGVGRMLVAFGSAFAGSIPVGELFTGMLVAVAVGVALAAVAAVYPSFRAARLAPMEAMRVE